MAPSSTAKEPSPLFNKPNATAILHSSDGVSFRVQTAILAEASPFFGDMFELPQSSRVADADAADSATKPADNIPSIDVTEDSTTLDNVLRFCYPGVADPVLTTLEELRPVLEAVTKYQLEQAIASVKQRLAEFASTEPVRVYALACLYELSDEARSAARHALRYPLLGKPVPELSRIPASAYHSLLQYHEQCQRAASTLAIDFS